MHGHSFCRNLIAVFVRDDAVDGATIHAGLHVAMALGISRAGAYTLLHSKGFPTIKIGKRLVVPRDKFIKWMDAQAVKTK